MKKTIFEEMGGIYVRCGDYFIPNLTLPEEEEPRFVGVWGQRHLQYLKEYRRTVYLDLLMSGRLNSYLADIEEQAQERFERIVEQMKQAQGITETILWILPTPLTTFWSAGDMAEHGIRMDLQQMTGLIPSTFQVVIILGIMAVVSFFVIDRLYKQRSE